MSNQRGLRVFVGTADGLHEIGGRAEPQLVGRDVTALGRDRHRWWAIVEGRAIWCAAPDGPWDEVARVSTGSATCLLPTEQGLLVGASGARLLRLDAGGGRGVLVPIESFESTGGRADWYTPWGDPPDTRSVSVDPAGTIYVNVHVGGVVRSTDGGRSWRPTLDIDTDVHQVLAHPERAGVVFAAAAVGLAVSTDAGDSWRIESTGLHGTYLRAVALAGDTILVTASEGHRGRRASVYRRRLEGDGPFERCREGLPDWFRANIDTACLSAAGPVVAFGAEDGRVFMSSDHGRSWELSAKGLSPVRCVALG